MNIKFVKNIIIKEMRYFLVILRVMGFKRAIIYEISLLKTWRTLGYFKY
jgi:hypothetical protein